jgi:hypothetical protein
MLVDPPGIPTFHSLPLRSALFSSRDVHTRTTCGTGSAQERESEGRGARKLKKGKRRRSAPASISVFYAHLHSHSISFARHSSPCFTQSRFHAIAILIHSFGLRNPVHSAIYTQLGLLFRRHGIARARGHPDDHTGFQSIPPLPPCVLPFPSLPIPSPTSHVCSTPPSSSLLSFLPFLHSCSRSRYRAGVGFLLSSSFRLTSFGLLSSNRVRIRLCFTGFSVASTFKRKRRQDCLPFHSLRPCPLRPA